MSPALCCPASSSVTRKNVAGSLPATAAQVPRPVMCIAGALNRGGTHGLAATGSSLNSGSRSLSSPTTAACRPKKRAQGRRSALDVSAFRRDDKPQQYNREHMLVDVTARNFVKMWLKAVMEGPEAAIMTEIDHLCDDEVKFSALKLVDRQGGKVRRCCNLKDC